MFNIDKAHYIVNEMVSNGVIIETNKNVILKQLQLLDNSYYINNSISSKSIFTRMSKRNVNDNQLL